MNIDKYEYTTEQQYDVLCSNEEIKDSLQEKDDSNVEDVIPTDVSVSSIAEFYKVSDFPQGYTEYMSLALKKRAELHGITDEKSAAEIFNTVRENFDNAGYNVSFDKKYAEAMAIERYIAARRSVDRTEVIADKLKDCGPYENISLSINAEIFGFSIDDSSSNLKLYMQVMKKLNVRMGQEEMFEDYQKVHEETMKRQDEYNKLKEKEWKHGRVR